MHARIRPRVHCVLTFLQSTTSMVSLCVTCYNLAYNIGKPWMWNDIVVGTCITTTILCNALRQSLDKMFLESYIIQRSTEENDLRIVQFPPTNDDIVVEPLPQRRTRSLETFHDVMV